MKLFTSTLFLLLIITTIKSQKFYSHIEYNGDTVKLEVIENPTVCDCENIDWRNKEQKKVCNLTFDYDFMSKTEKEEYDKLQDICDYPSICDCANVTNKNKGLLKACNRTYNYNSISETQLKNNIKKLKNCPKIKSKKLNICDCINIENFEKKKECNEAFFDDSLVSLDQRIENLESMKKCIENKEYNLDVTTCDCARYAEKDSEYKRICDEKVKKLSKNKRALTEYFYSLKKCKESQILWAYLVNKKMTKPGQQYSVCKCNEKDLKDNEIKECNTIWELDKMTEEQTRAYKNTASRCK